MAPESTEAPTVAPYIRVSTVRLSINLHPSRAHDVSAGVWDQLNGMLLRFNPTLQGVVLAHLEWKTLSKTAKILTGLAPYFHLDIVAKLLLFTPSINQVLEGRVNFVTKGNIGFVVLGVFYGKVDRSEMMERFSYSHESKRWTSKVEPLHQIGVDTELLFVIQSLKPDKAGFIEIVGSLRDTSTGCMKWLGRAAASHGREGGMEDGREQGKKRKTKKSLDRPADGAHIEDSLGGSGPRDADMPGTSARTDEENPDTSEARRKKRKRREHEDELASPQLDHTLQVAKGVTDSQISREKHAPGRDNGTGVDPERHRDGLGENGKHHAVNEKKRRKKDV